MCLEGVLVISWNLTVSQLLVFLHLFICLVQLMVLRCWPSVYLLRQYCRCSRNIACHRAAKGEGERKTFVCFQGGMPKEQFSYQSTQTWRRFSESVITEVTWLLCKSECSLNFYILGAICSWNKSNNYWCINTCFLWEVCNCGHQSFPEEKISNRSQSSFTDMISKIKILFLKFIFVLTRSKDKTQKPFLKGISLKEW